MNMRTCGIAWALAAVVALGVAGCGSNDESGDSSSTDSNSGDSYPTTPATQPQSAATTCESADVTLPDATAVEGVTFTLTTDPTGTSLLMKNSGPLTAVVVPDISGPSRLSQAPYANPSDAASEAALFAVARSGFAARVPGLSAGVPADQVYVVPPDWAVCVLSGRLGIPARARFLQDKEASLQYRTTRFLAGELQGFLTPESLKNGNTLLACARGAADVLQGHPDLQGFDLYAAVVGDGSACRTAYKLVVGEDEVAARGIQSRILTALERSPALHDTTQFVLAIARR